MITETRNNTTQTYLSNFDSTTTAPAYPETITTVTTPGALSPTHSYYSKPQLGYSQAPDHSYRSQKLPWQNKSQFSRLAGW